MNAFNSVIPRRGSRQTLATPGARVRNWRSNILIDGNANGPQYPEFYVDEDWRIPIAFLSYEYDDGHRGSYFTTLFWYRGNPASVNAHLFYNGKDLAKISVAGNEGSDWKPNSKQWGFANLSLLGI